MNTFVEAVAKTQKKQAKQANKTVTENCMAAKKSTTNAVLDLFYQGPVSRNKDIQSLFEAAFREDEHLATRCALWLRDVRGGAGERQSFRDILYFLNVYDPNAIEALLPKIAELGRWDDMFVLFEGQKAEKAISFYAKALTEGNGLAAKWAPRKGPIANQLRKHLGLTPKDYRKLVVNATNVVESQMCAGEWESINFSHVPSVASARYRKAFWKHVPQKYEAYINALVKGDPTVKINAGAIFPHDVLKSLFADIFSLSTISKVEERAIVEQWKALPNFVGEASVLPLIDTSGSMFHSISPKNSISVAQVAYGLGLYIAEKNRSVFKDVFLTFNSVPQVYHLKGNIVQKIRDAARAPWGGSTNLELAIQKMLDFAVSNKVTKKDMPKALIIFSDMQFNQATREPSDDALKMMKGQYAEAGYDFPRIIFWNLRATDNVPVKATKSGVALVSGFSPSIAKAILDGNLDDFTPEAIMLKTIMSDRYSY